MRFDDGQLGFSASDLVAFAGCGHRTVLEQLRALRKLEKPTWDDPRLDLLAQLGLEHERALLTGFEADGLRVVRFDELQPEQRNPSGYRDRARATLRAMEDGADVIHQGTLYDGHWLGMVDFLERVDRPSALGAWSYEVGDAKLAREAKASALLQVCVYSDLLEAVQGAAPEHVHLYLGGPGRPKRTFRRAHFAAYTRQLRRRFLRHVEEAPDTPAEAPDPVESCRICPWEARCQNERRAADHLSLVADIRRDQRAALDAVGVATLTALGERPLDPPPAGMRPDSFQRAREQARVQLEGRRRSEPYHEVIDPEGTDPGDGTFTCATGLAALPEPDPHDWFFDIESADFAYGDGLEYLFGVSDTDDGYEPVWALTPSEEKAALVDFLTRATAHRESHPQAHIYHYGHYETTALKRLCGRYGVGTDLLDELLEGEAFVNLHRVVRQGVRASVESYSIKKLEAFTGFQRSAVLDEANAALMRWETALAMAGAHGLAELGADRDTIEAYNRDDCLSTRQLRDWLETLRAGWEAERGVQLGRPAPPEKRPDREEDEGRSEVEKELLVGIADDPAERTPDQEARWTCAHLLDWHRREDKSFWWEYHALRELTPEEWIAETKPMGGLQYEGSRPASTKRSLLHRFRFPEQEHRVKAGKRANVLDLGTAEYKKYSVAAVDEVARTLDLKIGKGHEGDVADSLAFLQNETVPSKDHRRRLRGMARALLAGPSALEAHSAVGRSLLYREPPRFAGSVLPLGTDLLARASSAALALAPGGVLPIQGPPGTGKSYSGARLIHALLRRGYRVGITGPSHSVIKGLLDKVCGVGGDDAAPALDALQVSDREPCDDKRVATAASTRAAHAAALERSKAGAPPFNLVAGTSWYWCSAGVEETPVDVLVIDEAGQFALANAIAVAPAAYRMILLGDPQQLNQPLKGAHPPGTERSVLEHLAGEDGILDDDRGLFLPETWRMVPEITAFTSELFYSGKLTSRPELASQSLTTTGGRRLHGLFLKSVPHTDNSRASVEEIEAVCGLFRALLTGGCTYEALQGGSRALTTEDILVVAPYNAQVDLIRQALIERGFADPRVGTVDMFQGAEAPVAIYSLASSSAADAPRGMAFLYALDRLNVATSRARCASIMVASPQLLEAECRTPEQLRMVNAFARFAEMATDWEG